MRPMGKILALVSAAALASCALDESHTAAELKIGTMDAAESEAVTLDDEYALAATDCLAEDDCEVYPEQTRSQCLNACALGAAAIEAFCRIIVSPAIKAACWGVVNKGPQACANFCNWYFTP